MSDDNAKNDAQLGLATTRELLEELEARMHCSVPRTHAQATTMAFCRTALERLGDDDLSYRTVDS